MRLVELTLRSGKRAAVNPEFVVAVYESSIQTRDYPYVSSAEVHLYGEKGTIEVQESFNSVKSLLSREAPQDD